MPKNHGAELLRSPYRSFAGQRPLTRLLDLEDAMQLELVEGFSEQAEETVRHFTKACHSPRHDLGDEEGGGGLKELCGGGALWQAMEVLHATIRITGVTRVFTHQLVRQRIGVTFSQQCTGETDQRHCDFAIPRSMSNNDALLCTMRLRLLQAKMLYCAIVDNEGISIQEARYLLPPCQTNFIVMHACLGTLAALYQKRCCEMSQAWDMVVFAHKLKSLIVEKYPWTAPAFDDPCRRGACYYHKAKSSGFAITHLFAPSAHHDTFEWNPASFVHGEKGHGAVSSGAPMVPLHFVGMEPITEAKWTEKRDDLR